MYLARIVRANVLSLRELDYISAARALGASDPRIFFSHLLPNTIAPASLCLQTISLPRETAGWPRGFRVS